jgi:glycosyltransferase involved in cell wall biosynthesis
MHTPLRRVAFIGNYPPRRCGIATYTSDLRHAVARHLPDSTCTVVALDDGTRPHYPAEVAFECPVADAAAYERAADFLNLQNVSVVSLQHEYGIFGGADGGHVAGLLSTLRAPIHTTLHTVLARPTPGQRQVMDEVLRLSARIAVMNERGRALLRETHGVDDDRIDVIPHGIPDMPLADTRAHKQRLGLQEREVLLTFGLLSPNKGIETVIEALPRIVAARPRTTYVVLGATHPHVLQREGEHYREALVQMAIDLGVRSHVIFHDRYVDMPELLAFIGAADVYVTPYLGEDQITSGTLSYAFGCGKPVVSTPYWHAREMLADGRGVLFPFRDSAALAADVVSLLDDHEHRQRMGRRAWNLGREMVWERVAHRYAESLRRTRLAVAVKTRPTASAAAAPPCRRLPEVRLAHFRALTDSTGLLQHATYDIPRAREGYCTDDNARALSLMVMLEELRSESRQTCRAARIYASFVDHAFDPQSGRFRNFLSYDRRWLDEGGSDDCLGRAVAALGCCVGRSRRPSLRSWAMELFPRAIEALARTTSPRAWAHGILGIRDAMHRLQGDRRANAIAVDLVERLLGLHTAIRTPDWPWLEDSLAYENAKLCQALIAAGDWLSSEAASAAGLTMLEWLSSVQRSPGGRHSPVGCRGFMARGGDCARFDQQPIEAHATVSACVEAYRSTGQTEWLDQAWSAFEWFLGHNVLGLALCDPNTGGCRDGLLEDRTNDNQGAESTLAYLGALVEMRALTREISSPAPVGRNAVSRESGSPVCQPCGR